MMIKQYRQAAKLTQQELANRVGVGHTSNNMLHKVYQHIRSDAEKEYSDKLNNKLSEVFKKKSPQRKKYVIRKKPNDAS